MPDYQRIYVGGKVVNQFKAKIDVKENGVLKLMLNNVTLTDAGEYVCKDELGTDSAPAQLIVLGESWDTRSSVTPCPLRLLTIFSESNAESDINTLLIK